MKSTTSANRIDAEVNWSAIVWGSARSRSAIGARQHVEEQALGLVLGDLEGRQCVLPLLGEQREEREHDRPADRDVERQHDGREPRRQRGAGAQDLARDAAREEDSQERHVPADAGAYAAEDERAHRGEDAPDADAGGRDETAERDHRQGRREQDVEELDAQEQIEVSRPSEDRDRPDRDDEVHVGERTGRRPEREVEGAPQQRDRQDQHRHEHEQRLADARLLVVPAVGADRGQTREHGLEACAARSRAEDTGTRRRLLIRAPDH